MTDVDYEAIEAAVTETVRGRWFLNEFARRNRATESRQLLDAMMRLETMVAAGQAALPAPPSTDPSIRLLVQRIKEIAGHLDGLALDMREDGVDARYFESVDLQARAVAGLMRTGAMPRPTPEVAKPEAVERAAVLAPLLEKPVAPVLEKQTTPVLEKQSVPVMSRANHRPVSSPEPLTDPRLQALSGLDGLSLAKKIALFS